MQAIIIYLLKSILFTALPVGYYYLFLRNKKLYYFNRIYLLLTVPVSLLLPLVKVNWVPVKYSEAMNFKLLDAISTSEYEIENFSPSNTIYREALIPIAFFAVVLFLLIRFFRKIYWVNSIRHSYPSTTHENVTIVETDLHHAPFSFFSTIYWRDDISMESTLGQHIMKHEMTHVRLKHSLDKLFIQIMLVLFWVNPLYWLIDKELSLQHEFAADASATEGDSHLLSLMLLHTHFSPVFPQMVHPFFHSSIKQRLSMINLPGKTNFAFIRKALIAPILCGAVILFSYNTIPAGHNLNRSEKTIKVILDPGHGGTDNGTVAKDEIREKDLVMQITKRITELAPEYNISILPIRTNDETIDPKQRLIKSEKLGGDLYVSIHVNNLQDKQAAPGTGYSIVVSSENQKPEQSRELASAIIARFQKSGISFSLDDISRVWVLKKNRLPAVLLECGDINNANDVNLITNNTSLENMSRNILSGIVDYSHKK